MKRVYVLLTLMLAFQTVIVHASAVRLFPHLEGEKEENIEITEHIPETSRYKRSSDGFPDELDVGFPIEGDAVDLHLTRNTDLRTDIPIFLKRGDRIVRHKIPDSILSEQAVAYYYDKRNGSSFMAWHIERQTDKEPQFALFGIFNRGNKSYQIQPADQNHVTPDVTQVTHILSVIPEDASYPIDAIQKYSQEHERIRRHSDREKRQTVTAYEIESMFVVDFAVYSFWDTKTDSSISNRANVILNTINQFSAFILNARRQEVLLRGKGLKETLMIAKQYFEMINVRFVSVTGAFTMTCLYSGIYIADSSSAASFVENNLLADDGSARRKVDADVILPAFRDWANTDLAPTIDYDHAFLATGYDMGTFDNGVFSDGVAGYAYVGGVCDNNRYSINEDQFSASLATIFAHEVGHNLGSAHDGTGNACDGTAGYVMAASSTVTFDDLTFNTRQFSFSSCSIDYFSSNLDTLGSPNCLESRSSNYNSTALDAYSDDNSGQIYPPDTQCEYIIGSGSYFYRRSYTSYEDVCALMRCSFTNNNGSHWAKMAWEGTSCGNGKLCQGGSCVTIAGAPTGLDEECLFGDIPYNVPDQSETCVEFLGPANKSYNCYQSQYQDLCCATCKLHREANVDRTDCEYGDMSSGCATLSRSGCYANAALCCQSCAEQESSDPACLYGDRASNCDPASCDAYDETTRTSTCCESCAVTTTSTTTVSTSTATQATTQLTSTTTQSTSTQTTSTSTQPASTSSTGTTSSTSTNTGSTGSSSTSTTTTSTSTIASTTAAPSNNDNGGSNIHPGMLPILMFFIIATLNFISVYIFCI